MRASSLGKVLALLLSAVAFVPSAVAFHKPRGHVEEFRLILAAPTGDDPVTILGISYIEVAAEKFDSQPVSWSTDNDTYGRSHPSVLQDAPASYVATSATYGLVIDRLAADWFDQAYPREVSNRGYRGTALLLFPFDAFGFDRAEVDLTPRKCIFTTSFKASHPEPICAYRDGVKDLARGLGLTGTSVTFWVGLTGDTNTNGKKGCAFIGPIDGEHGGIRVENGSPRRYAAMTIGGAAYPHDDPESTSDFEVRI